MARFKIGDSVRSAPGGPLMTIKEVDTAGRAVCSWYQPGAGWQRQAFAEADLQKSYQAGTPRPKAGGRPTRAK